MSTTSNLPLPERDLLARDFQFYEVTEKHTWLKTADDIRAYIEHNFENVYGDSLHIVKQGMDYAIYAWRTKTAHQRIVDRWNEIKSWSKPDAPDDLRNKRIRFLRPRCDDFDFAVWVNGVYIGDVRRAHVPAFSPMYPASGRYHKPAENGWEACVEDCKGSTYKQIWHGFQSTRDKAAFQLFVCAMEQRPLAVEPITLKRGHV